MPGRANGRSVDEMRPLSLERGFIEHAPGSCLVSSGRTRIICTASVETGVPPWLRGSGQGWLTAEYGMLPGSTSTRKPRDGRKGRTDGRSVEIQRLIGRSLRQAIDLERLGERTLTLDCDVIQADGGTRCAAINGAFVALHDAIAGLITEGALTESPLRAPVGALSVGIVDDEVRLDLDYEEDRSASADMNVVMNGDGGFIEVQASAERRAFSPAELGRALELAHAGISLIHERQRSLMP